MRLAISVEQALPAASAALIVLVAPDGPTIGAPSHHRRIQVVLGAISMGTVADIHCPALRGAGARRRHGEMCGLPEDACHCDVEGTRRHGWCQAG